MQETIYQKKGYKDRRDYLESLAEEHNIPVKDVLALAVMLGKSEDFDGLVNAVEDYF